MSQRSTEVPSALSIRFLQAVFDVLRDYLGKRAAATWLWCGRQVKVLDGTSFSIPDTAANQRHWPQPSMHKNGCGFSVAKMVGVFCLSTGRWLGHALSKWRSHDLSLRHRLNHLLCKGDVLMGDAGFCAYALILQSGVVQQQELGRISFKGAVDLLRQWLPQAAACHAQPRKLARWHDELLEAIASVQNPLRPERREPHAKKRRPKSYQLLTSPRHKFQEIPHRERYRAAAYPSAIRGRHFIPF